MKKLFSKVLDCLYGKKCYCCNATTNNSLLCKNCYDSIQHNPHAVYRVTAGSLVFVAGMYEWNLKKIIKGLKFHGKPELAKYIARFMYDYFKNFTYARDFIVVPTPMYFKRRQERTYNHMELIAEEFCKLTGYKMNRTLINKVKDTRPQYELTEEERHENMKDAFAVDLTGYDNEPVLLIDDICTTGATLRSMVQALRDAGVNDITCLVASKPFY